MNEIKNNLLDYYLDPNTIVELHKIHQCNKKDSILNKCLKDGSSIDQVIDEIEMYRYTKQSQPAKTIAERLKLMPEKKKKTQNSNWNRDLNSKETIKQSSSAFSRYKS